MVVYGRRSVLEATLAELRTVVPTPLDGSWPDGVAVVSTPEAASEVPNGVVAVVEVDDGFGAAADHAASRVPFPFGASVAAFGGLQFAALRHAIADALAGRISAIVTAPWNKARLADAGLPPTGHTEVLASQSGVEDVVMVLAGDRLRVALATVHVPLAEVPTRLSVDGIDATVRQFRAALVRDWGIGSPRIAVCGLNPHAGEGGVIGDEERAWFPELSARWASRGWDVSGPWPADTLFPRVVAGRLAADGVVALYHDQGLVPLKTVHFGEAANITLGLPFVRTSVDHGTAYDIAGQCAADVGSFGYACATARRMVQKREAAGAGPAASR
jgi:4-hydroxythreonine-4-phosphate dehydrogenase